MDFRKAFDFPIHLYYYVPECPFCGSKITGRFIKAHRDVEDNWTINEALRNGELVRPMPDMPKDNAFCLTCGRSFYTNIRWMFVKKARLQEEKEIRQTADILASRYQDEMNARRNDNGLFKPIRRYIGEI